MHAESGTPNLIWELLGPVQGVRAVHIKDFGGPGNDSLSLAATDLSSCAHEDVLVAVREFATCLAAGTVTGLQLGCVPETCEAEVRSIMEGSLPSLRFIQRVACARRFVAPKGEVTAPQPSVVKEFTALTTGDTDLISWLEAKLLCKGYSKAYIEFLLSGAVAPPMVAVGHKGVPIAHVLHDAADLSLGALYVDEEFRGHGIGTWLLQVMGQRIAEHISQEQHDDIGRQVDVASLVEPNNEASLRLHARAGWQPDGTDYVWLVFAACGPP